MLLSVAQKLVSAVDNLNKSIAKIISWFILIMVCLTVIIVVLRYGFNMGWIAMQESVMYLHAIIFMLGSAYTLQVNGHVRVDIFYRNLPLQKQARVDFFGAIFLLLPVNLFIGIVSWQYVADSWWLLESSGEAGGLPFVYLLKSLILILVALLMLQGLAEIVRNGLTLLNHKTQES